MNKLNVKAVVVGNTVRAPKYSCGCYLATFVIGKKAFDVDVDSFSLEMLHELQDEGFALAFKPGTINPRSKYSARKDHLASDLRTKKLIQYSLIPKIVSVMNENDDQCLIIMTPLCDLFESSGEDGYTKVIESEIAEWANAEFGIEVNTIVMS